MAIPGDRPPIPDVKDKMSRALGAAFLTHQVAQLENKIGTLNNSNGFGGRRGGGMVRGAPATGRGRGGGRGRGSPVGIINTSPRKATVSEDMVPREKEKTPMANVIVLDASVLVHALGQVKRWCREERKETLVVPLEVLNTLDLLKKGTTTLAIRARAASRVLEAQVGANPRIHVQRDQDYIPWDEIYGELTKVEKFNNSNSATEENQDGRLPSETEAPEWIRQTICCALWEAKRPESSPIPGPDNNSRSARPRTPPKVARRVALAIVKPFLNPNTMAEIHDAVLLKYAPRASGDLLRVWAPIFDLQVLGVDEGVYPDRPIETRTRSPAEGGGPKLGHPRKILSRNSRDDSGRGVIVEKVRNGVNETAAVSTSPGAGKIRLLVRGEKLDP